MFGVQRCEAGTRSADAPDAAELTEASDIFSLGLIYAEYLTGAMLPFSPAHHEAAIAVLHGEVLRLPPGHAPEPVTALVERMLLAGYAARPHLGEIHAELMGLRSHAVTTARAPLPTRWPTVPRGLRPELLRREPPPRPPARPPLHARCFAAKDYASRAGTPHPRAPTPATRDAEPGCSASSSDGARTGARREPALDVRALRGGERGRPHLRGLRRRDDPAIVGCHSRARAGRAGATPAGPATPLPEPVQRAINREPIDDQEWPYRDSELRMVPVPGGCMFIRTPRRREW